MLKILIARLQQYMNRELPDVQAGFRKGRGTRDQIANIRWIIEKSSQNIAVQKEKNPQISASQFLKSPGSHGLFLRLVLTFSIYF